MMAKEIDHKDIPLWPACPQGAPLLIKLIQKASEIRYLERKLVSHRKNIQGMLKREKVIAAMLKRENARRERVCQKLEVMMNAVEKKP
jgi:hypothetical protein